jgi:hypothetical protein
MGITVTVGDIIVVQCLSSQDLSGNTSKVNMAHRFRYFVQTRYCSVLQFQDVFFSYFSDSTTKNETFSVLVW